ncbi:unnamed protein product [Agarophyton chilense]
MPLSPPPPSIPAKTESAMVAAKPPNIRSTTPSVNLPQHAAQHASPSPAFRLTPFQPTSKRRHTSAVKSKPPAPPTPDCTTSLVTPYPSRLHRKPSISKRAIGKQNSSVSRTNVKREVDQLGLNKVGFFQTVRPQHHRTAFLSRQCNEIDVHLHQISDASAAQCHVNIQPSGDVGATVKHFQSARNSQPALNSDKPHTLSFHTQRHASIVPRESFSTKTSPDRSRVDLSALRPFEDASDMNCILPSQVQANEHTEQSAVQIKSGSPTIGKLGVRRNFVRDASLLKTPLLRLTKSPVQTSPNPKESRPSIRPEPTTPSPQVGEAVSDSAGQKTAARPCGGDLANSSKKESSMASNSFKPIQSRPTEDAASDFVAQKQETNPEHMLYLTARSLSSTKRDIQLNRDSQFH